MVKVKTFLFIFFYLTEITYYAWFGPVMVVLPFYRKEWVGHWKARRKW